MISFIQPDKHTTLLKHDRQIKGFDVFLVSAGCTRKPDVSPEVRKRPFPDFCAGRRMSSDVAVKVQGFPAGKPGSCRLNQ
jgi:hypothetical protein